MERALVTSQVDRLTTDFTRSLRAALDGSGPAIAPSTHAQPPDTMAPETPHGARAQAVPDSVALVVATSGSGGSPRRVMLDADALVASAGATHDRLGGPGRWVLALPLQHIAGLQVVIRSLLAGADPMVVPAGPFDPVAVADTVRAARADRSSGRLYASLVPTQLYRIVAAAADAARSGCAQPDPALPSPLLPDPARPEPPQPNPALPSELSALADLDAILVGGAAVAPTLLDRARELGLRVVSTYGMTETAGGCVYDGVPLGGTQVRIDTTIHVAGPTLARGYLDDPDNQAFVTRDGVRWFRTADLGEVRDGLLTVHGRADDVIVTGGVNVAPAAVEAVLAGLAAVGQVCAVGLPDPEWGQVVVAVVVPAGDAGLPELPELRDAVADRLGAAAAPRALVVVDTLPLRGPGKVDRVETARLAADLMDNATTRLRADGRSHGHGR